MARKQTLAIVLHCTATVAHQDFRRAEIAAMHRRRGFRDIGYHYLVNLSGKVEIGRKPDNSLGAHVGVFNHNTLGVAYVGGLLSKTAKPADTRTKEQTAALEKLLRTLIKKYPNAVILGHRDLSPDTNNNGKVEPHEWLKVCPCFDAGAWAKSVGLPGGKYTRGKYVKL